MTEVYLIHARTTLTKSAVEAAALAWLAGVGWQVAHGRDIARARWTRSRATHEVSV